MLVIKSSKLLTIAWVVFAAAQQAVAQPLVGGTQSIESTVANADFVFVARITKIADAKRTDKGELHQVTITVDQTLKQEVLTDEPYQEMQICLPHSATLLEGWKEHSSCLLVALDEHIPWMTRVIDLAPGKVEVFKADFTLLRDPQAVIRSANETLKKMPAGVKRVHTFGRLVPHELVAETKWAGYNSLLLYVPVDGQLEKRAIELIRSDSLLDRDEGVRALRHFRSDENVERVKKLLKDPGWSYLRHPINNNGVEVRLYTVRKSAYQILKMWDVEVDKPRFQEEVRKTDH